MYVLTGIHGNGAQARIWDSEDGSTEDVDFITLAKQVTEKGVKVQGIRMYQADTVYPPDSQTIPTLGIVVVPSEAQTALAGYGKR